MIKVQVWLNLLGRNGHQLTAQHHRPLLVCFPQAAMMFGTEGQQMDLVFRVPVGFSVLFPVLLRQFLRPCTEGQAYIGVVLERCG